MLATDGTVLTTASAAELSFATEAGKIYVVERTEAPYAALEYAHITAERNEGAKALAGTSCTLGVGGKPLPDTGKYEAEEASLAMCSASGDDAASGFSEVTGLVADASVTFANVRAGTSLDVTYCTMNNPGKLSLYVNGAHSQDITFPNTMSWSGHYETVRVAAAIPPGATLKFQVDAGDAGANLDFIQVN